MRTIILYLLFSNFFLSIGQNSFIKWIDSPEKDCLGYINKLYNENFLIISYKGEQVYLEKFFNDKDILYILDQEGNFTDSLTIATLDEYGIIIGNMIRLDENEILLWAKARKADLGDEQLCLIWLDHNLNLLDSAIHGLETRNEIITDFTVNLEGNIVFVGYTELHPLESELFLWEFDINGQEIEFHSGDSGIFLFPTIHQLPFTGNYYVNEGGGALRYFYDFSFDTLLMLPNIDVFMSFPQRHKLYDDSHFLHIGMYMTQVPTLDPWDNAFLLIDNNYNIEYFNFFGAPDTTDIQGDIDLNSQGEIFLGGTKNYESTLPEDSWFALYKTNLNGDNLLTKFFGGHGRYWLTQIIATDDGGCLMGGTWWDFYNYPVPNDQEDIVLIKVDESGLVTGTGGIVPFEIADIIIFPNPGKNILNIQSALNSLTVYLFDQEGKQLLSQSFDGNTSIQTGNLKPGVYLYRVVQKNRIIKTGKWIKK